MGIDGRGLVTKNRRRKREKRKKKEKKRKRAPRVKQLTCNV